MYDIEILITEAESQIEAIRKDIIYHDNMVDQAMIKLNLAEFALMELKKI